MAKDIKNERIFFDTIEIVDNDDFLTNVKLRLLHIGLNRNNTYISRECVELSKDSFKNKPIVYELDRKSAYIKPSDVREHNEDLERLKIGGHIVESTDVLFVEENGKTYIEVAALIQNEYVPELVEILDRKKWKNKLSIEIAFRDYHVDDDGVIHIEKFILRGVCLLGERFKEGIEGSMLSLNSKNFKEDEVYNNFLEYAKYISSKQDEYGTCESIALNKSSKLLSNNDWSEVDKAELRKKVLCAKNYMSLIDEVYMKVVDGWEDYPSEKLKYPVMEIIDNELIYNRRALSSALAYAKKENEEDVVSNIEKIYKKLNIAYIEKEDFMEKENKEIEDFKEEIKEEKVFDEEEEIKEEIKEEIEEEKVFDEEEEIKEEIKEEAEEEKEEEIKEEIEEEEKEDEDEEEEGFNAKDFKEMKLELKKLKEEKQKNKYFEDYGLCLAEEIVEKIKGLLEDENVDYATFKEAMCSEIMECVKKEKVEKMSKRESVEYSKKFYSMPTQTSQEESGKSSNLKNVANKYKNGGKI